MTDDVRKFTICLDDVVYDVVAEGNKITVNGRPFTVETSEDCTVLVDGIAYEVVVEEDRAEVEGSSYALQVTGLSTGSSPSGAPRAPSVSTKAEGKDGAVVAMMPGQVTRLLVEEGERVEEGQPVCVLEAMKMENELRAERDGVIKAIHVRPGDDVEKGQALVEIR